MKKVSMIFLAALGIFISSSIMADECMDGDCDNGFGSGFTEDNKIYEGEWLDGLPHGHGKLYVSKGKVIEGRWEKGELVEEKEKPEKKENETKEK